mgnify:CR=1 FL=1
MCTVFTNQQTKPPTRNPPYETVGAAPVCPPERPRSGVSIPKYICASRIMHEDLTTDAPLWGDAGGHTGTAPTTLRNIFPHNPHKQNSVHVQSAPTHLHQTTRCAITPSGLYFPIAQGWQVQRCLPWVTGQARILPPLGVVLFLITHHYHMRRMDYSQMISPYEN